MASGFDSKKRVTIEKDDVLCWEKFPQNVWEQKLALWGCDQKQGCSLSRLMERLETGRAGGNPGPERETPEELCRIHSWRDCRPAAGKAGPRCEKGFWGVVDREGVVSEVRVEEVF